MQSNHAKPVVKCEFSDGYPQRIFYSFLNDMNKQATLTFSENAIKLEERSNKGEIITRLFTDTTKLLNYQYNPVDANGNSIAEFSIRLFCCKLSTALKSISRQDGVSLSVSKNPDKLGVKPVKAAGAGGIGYVEIFEDKTSESYPIDDYEDVKPHCCIKIGEFSRVCTNLNSNQCKSVKLVRHPMGIIFIGYGEGNEVKNMWPFSKDRENPMDLNKSYTEKNKDGKIIFYDSYLNGKTYDIPMSLITAVKKFNNIVQSGIARFYLDDDKDVMFDCDVGISGYLQIIICSK